jgi:putative SOS response-associated peptidase YedK
MCGRYLLTASARDIAKQFSLDVAPELTPRYNIAPTQTVLCIRASRDGDVREAAPVHWGLIPYWAKDRDIGSRMINARSESVREKPAFRTAFERRRCLVPADGFYEWRKAGARKIPHCFRLRDAAVFGMAGLWERWNGPDGEIESCTIITTEANDVVRPIHDRMPVILAAGDYPAWLDPARRGDDGLAALLRPCDPALLTVLAVSPRVNSPTNDGPDLLTPASG